MFSYSSFLHENQTSRYPIGIYLRVNLVYTNYYSMHKDVIIDQIG